MTTFRPFAPTLPMMTVPEPYRQCNGQCAAAVVPPP